MNASDAPHAPSERVAAAFEQRFGRPAAACSRAPGRVNLIGEHTDYTGGYVLPLAIDQACYVAAAPADGPMTAVATLWGGAGSGTEPETAPVTFDASRVAPGEVTGWAAYVAGTCWALRERLATDTVDTVDGADAAAFPAVDLLVDGKVPVGAGLSSSAALECAVAVALVDLLRRTDPNGPASRLTPYDLARLAKRCENEYVGAPTGVMDQMASMLGQAGHLLFLDTRSLETELVPFDPAAHGLRLLVIDTLARHALVDGGYAARRAACEEATALLGLGALRDLEPAGLGPALERFADPVLRRRVRHVVTENARVLDVVAHLRGGGDPRGIGPAMNASHDSLRDDFEVTVGHLDVAVDAARAAGAVGARMTGGGFGGSVIALVEAGDADRVTATVTAAFAERGYDAPVVFEATPSAGAGPVETPPR